MFVTRKGREIYRTDDFNQAMKWFMAGLPVTIHGWVKISRQNQEKMFDKTVWRSRYSSYSTPSNPELNTLPFKELIKYFPKWKIETQELSRHTPEKEVISKEPENPLDRMLPKKPQDPYYGNTRQYILSILKPFDPDNPQLKTLDDVQNIPEDVVKRIERLTKKGKTRQAERMAKKVIAKYVHKKSSTKNVDEYEGEGKKIMFNKESLQKRMPAMWKNFEQLKRQWISEGKDPNIKILYHGTHFDNINSIFNSGFRMPNHKGMLGRGVYAGPIEKARNYGHGIILILETMQGNIKEIDEVEDIDSEENDEYDSLHIHAGTHSSVFKGFLKNEEWVFKNPAQVRVIGVIIK